MGDKGAERRCWIGFRHSRKDQYGRLHPWHLQGGTESEYSHVPE